MPLVILVGLVPAGEQLAGKGSAGLSLPRSDRFPPFVFRAGDRRGAAAGGGVAVSRSASPQIPLNEIRSLERPSPPLRTSDRRAPVLLPAGAGTRVGLRRRAAPRAPFCKETGKTGEENAVTRPWPAASAEKPGRPPSFGFPSHAGLREADVGSSRRGGGGCGSRTAPSPAPPAAATSPLQLAAWLFCLIKLNVSVNFPPGRAALPLPESEFGYRCQRAPSGLRRARGDSPRRPRVATATGSWPWAAGPRESRGRTSPGPTSATGISVLARTKRVCTHRCDVCGVKSCPCVSRVDFHGEGETGDNPPGGVGARRWETWRCVLGGRRSFLVL